MRGQSRRENGDENRGGDLVRWFRDDFNNEAEWREIPDFVEFGGFRVPILKPKLPTLLSDGPELRD
jgi:hypothetical protein